MSLADIALAAAGLIAIALVGRVALSLLPPGRPGFHGPTELPITWAASHLLGSLVLVAERDIAGAFGLQAGPALLLAPWALVLVVRWVTLPGAVVPRHAPRAEIPGPLARSIEVAAAALVLVASFVSPPSVDHSALAPGALESVVTALGAARSLASLPTCLAAANMLALLCVCAEALRCARRAPLGRSAVLVSLSAVLALLGFARETRGDVSSTMLCCGTAAAFAVAWLRRADRRARALAILSGAGAALFGGLGWVFALAMLVALVARTPAPERARTAALSTLAVWPAVALALAGGRALVATAADRMAPDPSSRLARLAIAALLLVSAARIAWKLWRMARNVDLESKPASATANEIDEPRRELSALVYAAGMSFVLCAALGSLAPAHPSLEAIAPLLPICAVMVGLALVRPEQPFERA